MTELNSKEPEKDDAGCMAGCGTGSKKKKKRSVFKGSDQLQMRREPVEGVELLWQPEIVRSYLSIMAEASNPETLEGSAGAIHNLTACAWRVRSILGSLVFAVHLTTMALAFLPVLSLPKIVMKQCSSKQSLQKSLGSF